PARYRRFGRGRTPADTGTRRRRMNRRLINPPADGRHLALAILGDFERDALAFLQPAQPGLLDRRDVNEYVLRAVFGLNESEALLRVEPLHGANWHGLLSRVVPVAG